MSIKLGFDYESFIITKYMNVDEEESEDVYNYQTQLHTRTFRKIHDHNKQSSFKRRAALGALSTPASSLKKGIMCTDVAKATRGESLFGIGYSTRDVTPNEKKKEGFEFEQVKRCKVDPANPDILYKRTRHFQGTAKIGDHVHLTQAGFGLQFW